MFESSVLQRVGRQLMQGKTKRLHKFEVEGNQRPASPHFGSVGSANGFQFKADEFAQINRVSRCTADETLDPAESGQSRRQRVERIALADRSMRNRLYHRQKITSSMLKLGNENVLARFSMDDIGNI